MKPILWLVLPTFFFPCQAMTRRTGDAVMIPSGETIDDSLFAAGEIVRIDGTVNGDLIAFSRSVVIRGQINGNLYTAAQDVEIAGRVDGGLISFARRFMLDGEATENVYAFAQTVRSAATSRTGGDLSAFAQTVELEGAVARDAQVFANAAAIAGQIGRDATFHGEHLDVRNATRVEGNLTACLEDEENAQIAPGAVISGNTTRVREVATGTGFLGSLAFNVVCFAAVYLTGLAVLMIRPGPFLNAAAAVSHGWRPFLLGLAVLVLAPVLLLALAVTIIGIPLAVIGLALYVMSLFLSGLVVSAAVGEWLLPSRSRALALFVGLLIVMAFTLLPYGIGAVVQLIVICLGLGGMSWGIHHIPRARSAMEPMRTGWQPAG